MRFVLANNHIYNNNKSHGCSQSLLLSILLLFLLHSYFTESGSESDCFEYVGLKLFGLCMCKCSTLVCRQCWSFETAARCDTWACLTWTKNSWRGCVRWSAPRAFRSVPNNDQPIHFSPVLYKLGPALRIPSWCSGMACCKRKLSAPYPGIAPPHANDTERAVGKYSAKLRAIFLSSLPCRVGMCYFFMKTTRIKHAKSVVVKVLATGLDLQLLYLLAVRTHITYL